MVFVPASSWRGTNHCHWTAHYRGARHEGFIALYQRLPPAFLLSLTRSLSRSATTIVTSSNIEVTDAKLARRQRPTSVSCLRATYSKMAVAAAQRRVLAFCSCICAWVDGMGVAKRMEAQAAHVSVSAGQQKSKRGG